MTDRTPAPDGAPSDPDADETRIDGTDEAFVCERCGRPFASDRYRALHRGLAHAPDLSADEREAFESAREDEADALWRYRILAVGALVVLYFALLYSYAIFA